jgi:hypothetical protein
LPFLSPIDSPQDIANAAIALQSPENPHIQQAVAFALARTGDAARATRELERLMRALDVRISWQREMAKRAEVLKAKLLADPGEAQRQLEAWETESLSNLGLEKFREKSL